MEINKNLRPKLSIIVPVYNVRPYLKRCLDSIINQSFKDFELILVDDGSTDGSGSVCDEYYTLDSRIIVFHKSNGGLSSARNFGLSVARGEYVGFCDSDDWIENDMYDEMMNSINMDDADICICRVRFVNLNGDTIKVIGHDKMMEFDKVEGTKEILRDDKIPSFAYNKIYKRSLFDGIEYPIGRVFEDTATTYKLFYRSEKVIAIPYIGYNYLQNPAGICRTKHKEMEKSLMRDLHNALAFNERYVFAKKIDELSDVVPLCAFKSYMMVRSFTHMVAHTKYTLTGEQECIVDKIMKSFDQKDLLLFSTFKKMDFYIYRIFPKIYSMYLWIFYVMNRVRL